MSVTPIAFPTVASSAVDPSNLVSAATAAQAPQAPSSDFGQMVTNGIDQLEGLNDNADNLSVEAATGDLSAIHDYTIAATEATTATQLTVAVTNKAIEAFNSIMNMQV